MKSKLACVLASGDDESNAFDVDILAVNGHSAELLGSCPLVTFRLGGLKLASHDSCHAFSDNEVARSGVRWHRAQISY
jgi:hypothetical protein